MLNNKDIKKILPASKVTLQRIIKNIGKGSQQILNVKSKIQNYIANSSFYLNITNIYTQQGKDCKKHKRVTVVIFGVKFAVVEYHP